MLDAVRELTGAPATLSAVTPLMEAGVDSLAATELSSRLRSVTGVSLSPTLIFEYPSSRAVAMHLIEQIAAAEGVVAAAPATVVRMDEGLQLGVLGLVGRWAGGVNSCEAREQLQHACGDAMSSVPSARWVLELVIDERALSSLSEVQLQCVKHGGFVSGAERFDSRLFGVSVAEVGAMDPQQRLLLELGYGALHASGRRRSLLMGSNSGVFLGIERPDWAIAQPPSARASVYAVTGDNVSAAAGRLSFVLGLHGPCSSVDTACASALAAMHGGATAVRGAECAEAVALAVSLKLVPYNTLGAASAGMLSIDGRCKTLDARANGYARSEAVGALVLRACEDVTASALCLSGSAVRQDGRSASLTAPNGSAQRMLLQGTLGRAALTAAKVEYTEAHGTGTALGDPTEAGALAAVYGSAGRATPLTVGAAKANVGHSEAASGQVGLLKVQQLIGQRASMGNAHLRVLNPLVGQRFGASAACFVLPLERGRSLTEGVAGVSSFGFSGTIAHALMQRAEDGSSGAELGLVQPLPQLAFRRRAFTWIELDRSSTPRHLTSVYVSCWVVPSDAGARRPSAGARSRVLCVSCGASAPGSTIATTFGTASTVALLLSASETAAPSVRGVEAVLALAQQLRSVSRVARFLVLTCGVQASSQSSMHAVADAAHGGAWGLMRVVRLEHAEMHAQSVDVARAAHGSAALVALAAAADNDAEAEAAWGSAGRRQVARLRQCGVASSRSLVVSGVYSISGGLGGLGLRAASLLVTRGASRVLLSSRSGRVARDGQGLSAQLHELGKAAELVACDSADLLDMAALRAAHPQVSGYLHAAGAGDRGLLTELEASRVRWMLAPKAAGAWYAHYVFALTPLDVHVLFSSVGSGLGNVGQANYAAGNSCLDAYALAQRAHGVTTCS